jgi:hypothetical protein
MKLIILNKYMDLFTNNCIQLRFMLDFLPLSIEFDTVNATVDEIFKLSTKNAIKFISIGLIKSFVSQFLNFDFLLVKLIPYFNLSHNYDFHFECLMYISKFYLRNQLYIDFFKILINIPLSEAESSKIFIELSKNFKLDDNCDWQLFLEYKSKHSINNNKKDELSYLSDNEIGKLYRISNSKEDFSVKLVEKIFTFEERLISNCTGKYNKTQYDLKKLNFVKRIIFNYYPSETEKDEWLKCIMEIHLKDTRLRDHVIQF